MEGKKRGRKKEEKQNREEKIKKMPRRESNPGLPKWEVKALMVRLWLQAGTTNF